MIVVVTIVSSTKSGITERRVNTPPYLPYCILSNYGMMESTKSHEVSLWYVYGGRARDFVVYRIITSRFNCIDQSFFGNGKADKLCSTYNHNHTSPCSYSLVWNAYNIEVDQRADKYNIIIPNYAFSLE